MSRCCYICGKGATVGHKVSRSGHKTKRRWLPNLQRKRIKVNDKYVKAYVCASCLKSGKVQTG